MSQWGCSGVAQGGALEIGVLGPLLVVDGEGEPVTLPGGRVRQLLLRLVVAGTHSLPVDRLAADLWSESGARTTTSTVRTYIARLRGALPEDVVATRVGGYALDHSKFELDADRFERDVREARRRLPADPGEAADTLARALDRWRGHALEEVAGATWAEPTTTRLEEARLAALELRAEAQLAAGRDPGEIARHLAELTGAHPLRERLWMHRMVALYRCGQQADALARYQDVRRLLDQELGLEPSAELRELERAILAQDPSLDGPRAPSEVTTSAATPGGHDTEAADGGAGAPEPSIAVKSARGVVAPGTSLIGRVPEREHITTLLEREPVVTLTGPGGVGKSRLALEVARELPTSEIGPGVTVELASLHGPTDVENAVAAALGVARRGTSPMPDLLRDSVRDTTITLVLDNAEHVVEHVARLVDHLVGASPGVRVLATSREPLGASGERIVPVEPLAVPREDAPADEARQADAVRLFEDRARLVSPDLAFDDATTASVARICRRLDGLPFAIELAAARMRVLTPRDVETRLDERFGLLTGAASHARHETLREAIAWSYDLLSDDEQRGFRQLSVFVSAFDVAGASAVTGLSDDAAIDLVARLIDRSLLSVQRRGERVWYRMLETVRAFGLERLEDAGELVATKNRHATYLADVASHAGTLLHGPREADGHALLDAARDDLRSAFGWSLVTERWATAARIVVSVPWERVGRSLQWDVARWAARLVGEDAELDPRTRALVLATATIGHWLEGEADRARETGDAALEVARRLDEETFIETALAVAWTRWEAGDIEGAAELYLPLATPSLGDKVRPDVAAYCLGGMVMGMTERGDLSASDELSALAAELVDAASELAERSACPAALAMAHLAHGYSLLDVDPDAAREQLQRVADVKGLALPTWALHARSHLARFRAASGEHDGLFSELREILRSALAAVDEMHLRFIGGFVGGALAVAGHADRAPSLRPLAAEAFTESGDHGWRRAVAELLGAPPERSASPSLSGLDLERAIRMAISDLGASDPTASPD